MHSFQLISQGHSPYSESAVTFGEKNAHLSRRIEAEIPEMASGVN